MKLINAIKDSYSLLKLSIIVTLIDYIYLKFIIKGIFKEMVKNIQVRPLEINPLGVLIAYIFIVIAIEKFIIIPKADLGTAFLLGLAIYGIYEGTNLAVFNQWSLKVVVIDTIWGGILFYLTTRAYRYFNESARIKK